MHCNSVYHIYGREKEVEYLQGLINSVHRQHRSTSTGNHDDCSSSKNADNDIPMLRNRLFKTSTLPERENGTSNDCQMVLIHGTMGSGKKTFANSAIRAISGCIHKHGTINIDEYEESNQCSFLLASGRYKPLIRTAKSTTSSENTVKVAADGRPFSAFYSAIIEMMDMISRSDNLMNKVYQNLAPLMKGQDEIHILTELFPFMENRLRLSHSESSSIYEESIEVNAGTRKQETERAVVTTLHFKQTLYGSHLMEQQSQTRRPALIHLLQAVACVIPLVILLEDFQHADAASVTLVESLLSKFDNETTQLTQLKGLHIVATYRTDANTLTFDTVRSLIQGCQINCNCVSRCNLCMFLDSGSSQLMKELPKKGISRNTPTINSIVLSELTWDDVNLWIQSNHTFQKCTLEKQKNISDLIYHHCYGNPLRAQYIILFLEGESFCDEINKKQIPRTLGELYTKILLRQSKSVQEIVKTAAALIHSGFDDVSNDILEIATDQPCIDYIVKAEENKLLQQGQAANTLNFSHGDFQEAAYNTILDRPLFHLDIGRRIWRNAILFQDDVTSGKANDENSCKVLLATLQLRNSIPLLSDMNERVYMSQLCYETGHKLISVGDYKNAAKIFDFAICVLGTEIWRDDIYEASLALHNASVQAYCYSGDIDSMEDLLDSIFTNARSFHDQVPAYIALIYAQGTRHQLVDLVQTVSVVLKELGEPLNQNPSKFDIMTQMMHTQWILDRRSDGFLLNLPNAENENYKIVVQILCFAMHHTFPKAPEMCVVICCRIVRLAIKNGMTGPSAQALSLYGSFLSVSGNFNKGYRFGQLAIRLVDKFETWLPRTYLYTYGYTNHWIHPIRACLEPLSRAIAIAYRDGDFEIYGLLSSAKMAVMLFGGLPLTVLKKTCRSKCQSMAAFGCTTSLLLLFPIFDFIDKISGDDEPINIAHEIKNADTAFKYSIKEGDKFCTGRWYMHRTMLLFLTGEYFEALVMAERAAKQSPITGFILPFYHGLSASAIAWTCKSSKRRKYLRESKRKAVILKRWCKQCPVNFKNKYLLLAAEISGLKGNTIKALDLYNKSIECADNERFISEKAIAYERVGRYHLYLDNIIEAKSKLLKAKLEYEKWGSKILSENVDTLIHSIG